MFDTLKRLYKENKITELDLDKAILNGWITTEQKNEIVN